ncbi:MAG TPA: hypothetical protein VM619_14825 [Luteimonas sp.]|nr:hypothetical protein [Luteimonas sp.]
MSESAAMGHYLVEDDSLRNAVQLIEQYETFHAHPHTTPRDGVVIGFLRRLGTKGITLGEARVMLRGDLTGHLATLRNRIFSQDATRLGAPRIAVILHLAQVMGVQYIADWRALWADLSAGDFDAAANLLLLSEWPRLIGETLQERQRAVVLQQILRTGVMPPKGAGR